MGRLLIDMTGERYGRLLVVSRYRCRGAAMWVVRCDCGTEKIVAGGSLRSGDTQSCGCLHKERTSAARTTHGATRGSRTDLYRIWRGIISRCTNPHLSRWPRYGGRGITVCDRWRHDFTAFAADMGPRPSPQHSIDRIDPDGHYTPGNCRWATALQQRHNRSTLSQKEGVPS